MKVSRAAVVFALAIPSLFAQAGAGLGSISGSVKDPSGASVPNAKIVVANDSNGVRRNLESNNAGLFTIPALPPSPGYTVTVEAPGFAPWSAKQITVLVGQNTELAASLQ